MKNIILIVLILLLVIVVIQAFQVNRLKSEFTGYAIKSSGESSGVDMTGWSEDEKMMYEHHGTLPARLQQNSGKTPSMVGGC